MAKHANTRIRRYDPPNFNLVEAPQDLFQSLWKVYTLLMIYEDNFPPLLRFKIKQLFFSPYKSLHPNVQGVSWPTQWSNVVLPHKLNDTFRGVARCAILHVNSIALWKPSNHCRISLFSSILMYWSWRIVPWTMYRRPGPRTKVLYLWAVVVSPIFVLLHPKQSLFGHGLREFCFFHGTSSRKSGFCRAHV